jgi:rare lipoprotein A
MDLSYAAAVRLGVSRTGTARVELEALDPDAPVDTRFAQAAPVPPPPSPPRRAPMPRAVAPMASGPSAASIVAGGNTLAALDDDDAAAPVELLPPSPDDRASTAPARAAAAPIAVVPAVAPPMLAMSAVPAPTPAPPAPTPAPAGAGARVQVGAVGDEANARRLVDRLAGAGLAEAAVDTLAAGERTLWRVSLGAIDAEAAAALVERLRAMGLPGARVLRR